MKQEYNQTMYQAVKECAKTNSGTTAIYYKGKRISYKKFIKEVDRMADILANKLNVKKGDCVLLAQPNIPEVLICFYALNKIGAITNFVHPFTPYNRILSIYKKTHSVLAILFEQRIAKEVENYRDFHGKIVVTRIEDHLPLLKKIFYHTFMNRAIRKKLSSWRKFNGFDYLSSYKPSGKPVEEATNETDVESILLHSGSTTGNPKTIRLSNYAFNFLANRYEEMACVKKEEVRGKGMLSVLPSFHGFGLGITMHMPLCNGLTCTLIPKFSSKEVVKAMNKIQMSVLVGTPGVYESLLANEHFKNHKSLKRIDAAFSGGDKLVLNIQNQFDACMSKAGSRCRLYEGYGLTEALSVVSVNTFEHNYPQSIGYPISGVIIKIIDQEENQVKPLEIGEIVVKSPTLMLGYYDDEEATKKTFTKDGFLKTGDLGYQASNGCIIFKQRKKRVVKVSGVAVFPSEIENLVETVPGVKECCAISIPDPRLQSAIKLVVVAKFVDEEGMKQQILEQTRKYLFKWAIPKEIEFVDELPHTPLGKVDFVKLQNETNEKYKK